MLSEDLPGCKLSVQLPKRSTRGEELDTKELETFQSPPVNVYANMGQEYWGIFYMIFVFKAGSLWYYSPIKSQWHQGYTWLLQMLFPNKNTVLQLHQTLDPMTWISWNRSHQLWNKKSESKIIIYCYKCLNINKKTTTELYSVSGILRFNWSIFFASTWEKTKSIDL